jgi:hypothetical protein
LHPINFVVVVVSLESCLLSLHSYLFSKIFAETPVTEGCRRRERTEQEISWKGKARHGVEPEKPYKEPSQSSTKVGG